MERYIHILTSNVQNTNLNVHQVLGLQIANHEKLQLLNWQQVVEFNPSDYSGLSIFPNQHEDDLVRGGALIDTKILNGIWNDTNLWKLILKF